MKASSQKEQSPLPTVAAAALALLATSSGAKASDSNPSLVPPAISKRQNEDEQTPFLVLTPSQSAPLYADHSSHASHSSHYSSSGGGDYVPPTYTPPAPSPDTPSAPPPPPPPPSEPPAPQATQLDSVVLNKLAQVPALWPKQVKLLQTFDFTEIKDGVAIGTVEAPAGTLVDLIAVKGTKLVVSCQGNKAEIDASITDIGDRVDINAIVSAPVPPAQTNTNVSSGTPPSTGAAGSTP